MKTPSIIHFYFHDTSITLDQRTRLKAFISKLFKKEGKRLKRLNYIFCTDKELLRLNKIFLDHDFFTDILTFDLSTTPGEKEAEIYISAERIRENAKTFKTTLKMELLRVIFHGALHLCGYKDKTVGEREKMSKKENVYLKLYLNQRFT